MKHEHRMPPKNPAFVQQNVRHAVAAWAELGARITDPADRERLRVIKLAIADLDAWQTRLAETLREVVGNATFAAPDADARLAALHLLEEIDGKGEPA